jgi:uncharacterized protein (UPF0128 family)
LKDWNFSILQGPVEGEEAVEDKEAAEGDEKEGEKPEEKGQEEGKS